MFCNETPMIPTAAMAFSKISKQPERPVGGAKISTVNQAERDVFH